jgi:hypothetical protein
MRTSVEDLQQTQEASSVNVQPTKQAIPAKYTYLRRRQLFDAPISDKPETYLVSMYATARLSQQSMSIVRTYDERHPLMAVGRAVTEFFQSYNGQIEQLLIQKKIQNR